MKRTDEAVKKRRRRIAVLGVALFAVLLLGAGWLAGKPLLELVGAPEQFRRWVEAQGLWGPVLFVGMMMLQVIITVIPGGPFEVAAGYAFGTLWGTALCLIATTLGGALVFWAVRRWGTRVVELFVPLEEVQALPVLRDRKKLYLWSFVLMLIPGTPKDAISYAMGLTAMPFSHWVAISAVARIPAIALSAAGGDALEGRQYAAAVVVFAVTAVAAGLGLLAYCGITGKK